MTLWTSFMELFHMIIEWFKPKSAIITGTVTADGAPVENAIILLFKKGSTNACLVAASDARGEFMLAVDRGEYRIQALKANPDNTWWEGQAEVALNRDISVDIPTALQQDEF